MFLLWYAASCALLHHLLSHHYQDACRPSWLFGADTSAYCALVHRAIHGLRASPIVAAAVGRLPLPQHA